MTRHPDVPCTRCGRLLWRHPAALPAGQRVCRPCATAATAAPPVQVGQVWASLDPRRPGRLVRVTALTDTHAVVHPLADDDPTQRRRHSIIRLDRFRIRSRGYQLHQQEARANHLPEAVAS